MNRSVLMRGRKKPFVFLLEILCLLGLSVGSAVAQFDTGTLNGTVVDSSGALLPGASVTVTNSGTGATVTLKSNGAGIFSASALPFGTYTVTATAAGFGTTTSSDVVLNVGAAVHLTLKLSASGAAETVTVTGTATSVNTESAVSGESFNSKQVENLPVNGRDVDAFLEISPGSVGSAPEFQGSVNGLENIFSGLNITVDGQSAVRGDITGFLNTEGQEQPHITRSSIDSIQEIDFANNGYSAETGHSLGPQMNIITKGGTNTWHGTAFEFFRNDALDARDYFDTGAKEPLKLNQFGGNVSGPILHDKLFFFANYEGSRQHVTTLNPSEPHAERLCANAVCAFDAACSCAACAAACGLRCDSDACFLRLSALGIRDRRGRSAICGFADGAALDPARRHGFGASGLEHVRRRYVDVPLQHQRLEHE